MAIIGFIFGGVFGILAALVAWLGFDASLTTAFTIYLSCGFGGGLLACVPKGQGPDGPTGADTLAYGVSG